MCILSMIFRILTDLKSLQRIKESNTNDMRVSNDAN